MENVESKVTDKLSLSARIRPDVEAASWVVDEVKTLEAQLSTVARELEVLKTRIKQARVVTPQSMGLSNIYLIDGVDWERLKMAVE